MSKSKGVNTDMINSIPRSIRVEIATKIEKRLKDEVGEYHTSKNNEYKQICREIGEDYGLSLDEAVAIYTGWQAYKIIGGKK